jgi:hypothetical protein
MKFLAAVSKVDDEGETLRVVFDLEVGGAFVVVKVFPHDGVRTLKIWTGSTFEHVRSFWTTQTDVPEADAPVAEALEVINELAPLLLNSSCDSIAAPLLIQKGSLAGKPL